MNVTEWKKERNDSLKGGLVDCHCGYKPKNYLDFVYHRRDKHDIPPGDADIYKP